KVYIPSNTVLLLDSGVIFQNSGQLGPEDSFINIADATNVYISGYGAKVLGDRDAYPPGEQRHGVLITESDNVVIDGLEAGDNAVDGFTISAPEEPPQGQFSQNIVMND